MAKNTKNTEAAPANEPEGLKQVNNNKLEIVDNTDAVEAPVVNVEAEERPLLGDLVQVNYV